MRGKITIIGKPKLLCSFSYNERNYYIAIDESDECKCGRLKQSLWNGNVYDEGYTSDRIVDIANEILQRASNSNNDFPLEGEHYRVKNSGDTYGIEKTAIPEKILLYEKFVPYVFQLLLAMFSALFYAFICVNSFRISIAANVFNNLSREKLSLLIYALQFFGCLALFFLNRHKEDLLTAYINALIPYNLVALVGVFKSNQYVRIAVLSAILLFVVFEIILKIIHAISGKKKRFLKSALRRCYCLMIVLVIISCISVRLGVSFYPHKSNISTEQSDRALASFEELKDDLRIDKWEGYDYQKKLDCLQVICNYECYADLGCTPPVVVSGHPSYDEIYGDYNHIHNKIMINIDHLKNDKPEDVIKTLLHEARHAYQHAAVKSFNKIEKQLESDDLALYQYKKAASYRENIENYKSGSKDFDEYYNQTIEVDSREWAQYKVYTEYYNYIYPDDSKKTNNN